MLADMQNRSDQTDSRAAVEDIGHLTQKICTIWGTPELDAFLSALLMDARDGARKGLPVEVAIEILFLVKVNKMLRALALASKLSLKVEEAYRLVDEGDQARLGIDPLDDPLVSRDTITRSHRGVEAKAMRPAETTAGSQVQGLVQLMGMLIRSRWLAWAIVLVLGFKFFWPAVKALV
ncbi:MAG: hypothetical protein WCI19_04595 [Betaproteobacteria bacterium]